MLISAVRGDPIRGIVTIMFPDRSLIEMYQRCPDRFHVADNEYWPPSSVIVVWNGTDAVEDGTKGMTVMPDCSKEKTGSVAMTWKLPEQNPLLKIQLRTAKKASA